jgi:RNA polymerase-binding transcription factor
MSAHLTAAQLSLLEAELLQRRRQLDRRLDEHHGGQSRADHARELIMQDVREAAQREGERELDMAIGEHERRELGGVNQALTRIREGRYGVCVDCGNDIPFERLKVEPQALRCVDCERQRERSHY